MQFADRHSAGVLLAVALKGYSKKDTVVYALPRGGVVVASPIVELLKVPLDLVITRKIGHPTSPEYAVCAIAENGETVCDALGDSLLDSAWFKKEKKEAQKEIKRRKGVYLKGIERTPPEGKVAIVVDDGIATGLTIRAAVAMLKEQKPKEIVVAVPVTPYEVAETLRNEGCRVIALLEDRIYLGSVGSYYDEFEQVTDVGVLKHLKSVKRTSAREVGQLDDSRTIKG